MVHVIKDDILNPPLDEDSGVVVSEKDIYNQTLNFTVTNLGWKDDEFEPVTLIAKSVKEVIGRCTHIVDLSTPYLSLSIPLATSRNKREIEDANEILR